MAQDQLFATDGQVSSFIPLASKYDAQSSIAADLLGGTVASIADAGVSIFNSLVPEKYETSTLDLLTRLDSNALRVYEEHPDAIHTASFIGGLFLPAGLALKGMNLARSGVKGVNWFSESGRVAQMQRVNDTLVNSGKASAAYKAEIGTLYRRNFVNVALDNVAMELAIVGSMNAHPFMEDYLKEPAKHFMISVGLGTLVGGAFSTIGLKYTLGREAAIEYENAAQRLLVGRKEIEQTDSYAIQVAQYQDNIKNWQAWLDPLNPNAVKAESMEGQLLTHFILSEKAAQRKVFENMLDGEMAELAKNPEAKEFITQLMTEVAENPSKWVQVNKVRFATAREELNFLQNTWGQLTGTTVPKGASTLPLTKVLKSGPHAGEKAPVTMVYSPRFQAFMFADDYRGYSVAADLEASEKNLTKGLPGNWFETRNPDAAEDYLLGTSGYMDLQYLKKLKAADEIGEDRLARVAINPEDGPALNAFIARLEKLSNTNPTLASTLKFFVTKEAPNWENVEKELISSTIQIQIQQAAKLPGGAAVPTVSADHLRQLENILRNNINTMGLMTSRNLSPDAASLAQAFSDGGSNIKGTYGGQHLVHRGLEGYRRGNHAPQRLFNEAEAYTFGNKSYKELIARGTNPTKSIWFNDAENSRIFKDIVKERYPNLKGPDELAKRQELYNEAMTNGLKHNDAMKLVGEEDSEYLEELVKEIYNSKETTALRKAFAKHADADGHFYIYRGMSVTKLAGSTPGESFTPNFAVALRFGHVQLYKAHLDDIFGYLEAFGGNKYGGELEVVLDTPARTTVKAIPTAGATQTTPVTTQAVDAIKNFVFDLKQYGIDPHHLSKQNKQLLGIEAAKAHQDFIATNPLSAWTGTLDDYNKQLNDYVGQAITQEIQKIQAYTGAVKASTTQTVEQMGLAELDALYRQLVIENIKEGIAAGTPLETLMLKNGTTKDFVQAVMAKDDVAMQQLNYRAYSSADSIAQYFGNDKRGIAVSTTASKIPTAEIRQTLQQQQIQNIDEVTTQMILQGSGSPIIQELAAHFYSTEGKIRKDVLQQSLMKINPANVGSKFFQSSDFALRDMGEAGKVIPVIGKDNQHFYAQATETLFEPISVQFNKIAKSPAAIVDFNTARELQASVGGRLEYDPVTFMFMKEIVDSSGQKVMIPVEHNGAPYVVATQEARDAFNEIQKAGRHLYEINTTKRKILGLSPLPDRGFWMPAFNPRNKYITFVLDNDSGATRLLHGNTPEELKSVENAFKAMNPSPRFQLIRNGDDRAMWNAIHSRHDPIFMASADLSKFHSGSSSQAIVSTSANSLTDLAQAYEHYIHKSVGEFMEIHYADAIHYMDQMSKYAQSGIKGQPVSNVQKAMDAPFDAGLVAKNTLLGKSDLHDYVGWVQAQNTTQTAIEWSLRTIKNIFDPIITPTQKVFGVGKVKSDKEYEALLVQLQQKGIPNPFERMDDFTAKQQFHVDRISKAPNMTPRVIALSNGLAATVLLRVLELGQPLVNMLSLPILTSAAVQQKMLPKLTGTAIDPTYRTEVVKTMYEGVRYMFHPDYKKYADKARTLGVFTPVVAEITELMQLSRSFQQGALQKVENGLNSQLVNWLSKPADMAERYSREVAFAIGVNLAKRAYPGIGDAGIMTFARHFVDTAIGNYNSVQRPVMFQGTLGIALGLFQTYFLTLAQAVYRNIELRDFKALAKTMLIQGSIFGAKSLPGFNQVSELIGEHFSDQNYDLTTGTYRALPDSVADIILYGLPSNLGPAVYTRGDIQPRIPNIFGGVQNIAAVNILQSAWQAGDRLIQAGREIGDPGLIQAMGEALSVQNISRPVARISELMTGHAVTRTGKEIAGPEEIYSFPGIAARVFASRSLTETKAREAEHLDTMYGSLDRKERQDATRMLANHIRSGTLTADIVERIQEKYMRTGSPTGWRAAYQKAMIETDMPGVSAVRNHLNPRSPAQLMIEDL